jgi:hypothetical protein
VTAVQPAQGELLDLAAVMRPDWQRRDLEGALAGAAQNGWPWPRAFLATARLLTDPEAKPRDLLEEIADPLERRPSLSTEDNARYADLAKAALASALEAT